MLYSNYDYDEMYEPPEYIPQEGDKMADKEGEWFFEDGEWWLL